MFAFFRIDAVVFDAFDRDKLLDAIGLVISCDGVVFVVEQFFIFGDDEQFGTVGERWIETDFLLFATNVHADAIGDFDGPFAIPDRVNSTHLGG